MHATMDRDYLLDVLQRLLAIPSPSGMTDEVVRAVCGELDLLFPQTRHLAEAR